VPLSKERRCLNGRTYSWRVAPLQSQIPLPSGHAKIMHAAEINQMYSRINPMWVSVPARSAKEKSNKKENKGMGFAHDSFSWGFLRHRHQDRRIIEISMKLITFILHQIMCSFSL
jgi:hypothetical protein